MIGWAALSRLLSLMPARIYQRRLIEHAHRNAQSSSFGSSFPPVNTRHEPNASKRCRCFKVECIDSADFLASRSTVTNRYYSFIRSWVAMKIILDLRHPSPETCQCSFAHMRHDLCFQLRRRLPFLFSPLSHFGSLLEYPIGWRLGCTKLGIPHQKSTYLE